MSTYGEWAHVQGQACIWSYSSLRVFVFVFVLRQVLRGQSGSLTHSQEVRYASQILFNPKTVKSQIQGGIYSLKCLGGTLGPSGEAVWEERERSGQKD